MIVCVFPFGANLALRFTLRILFCPGIVQELEVSDEVAQIVLAEYRYNEVCRAVFQHTAILLVTKANVRVKCRN